MVKRSLYLIVTRLLPCPRSPLAEPATLSLATYRSSLLSVGPDRSSCRRRFVSEPKILCISVKSSQLILADLSGRAGAAAVEVVVEGAAADAVLEAGRMEAAAAGAPARSQGFGGDGEGRAAIFCSQVEASERVEGRGGRLSDDLAEPESRLSGLLLEGRRRYAGM